MISLAFIFKAFPVAIFLVFSKSPFISIFPLPVARISPVFFKLEVVPVPFKLIFPSTSILFVFFIFSVTVTFKPLFNTFPIFSKLFALTVKLPVFCNFSVFIKLEVVVIVVSPLTSNDVFSTSPLPAEISRFPPNMASPVFLKPLDFIEAPFLA